MNTRRVLRSALAGVCLQALTVLASGPAFATVIPQSQPVPADQAQVWFLPWKHTPVCGRARTVARLGSGIVFQQASHLFLA
jgi:hypothetical protein